MNKVLYNDKIVDIHILYLHSLKIAHVFYRSKGLGMIEERHGGGESTFYYLAKEVNQTELDKLKVLWKNTHDVTTISDHHILDYNQEIHDIKYHTDCMNSKSRVSFFTKSRSN